MTADWVHTRPLKLKIRRRFADMRNPTTEEISIRAYQIYLERACQPGHEENDWLQAEYELMQLPTSKNPKLDQSQPPKSKAVRKTSKAA
jgi:hypothetical protein